MRGIHTAALAALVVASALPAQADAPPVIVLGSVPIIECTANGKGTLQLDASSSYDPEGAPLTFSWWGPASISYSDPANSVTTATTALGKVFAKLTVSDGGASTTGAVLLDVRDTSAPTSALRVDGARLSNGWFYRGAQVTAVGSDTCDSAPCGSLVLRGTSELGANCGGVGLYGPGAWTAEHWSTDASGNAGAHTNSSPIVVVYSFKGALSVPTREILDTKVEVQAIFDGMRPVPGATVAGSIHRITGYPGSIDGVLRFPFSGTTDENGVFRFDAPLEATLPGEYRVRATTSALGLSSYNEMTYIVGLV